MTSQAPPQRSRLFPLCLSALGVVYGDIGTSPLYALRECFHGEHGVAVSRDNILGVLSLIFWSLVIVVTVKYHVYVLRADNRGEGGILALMALVRSQLRTRHGRWLGISVGLFGAALLYGDGIITPAISVLGAVEGLDVATPVLSPYVVPVAVAILVGLFLFQRRGTAGIGAVFGPVMLVWFSTLAVLGIAWIARRPEVLAAVNPAHAVAFFAGNGAAGFLVLGAVFLVATGGEALYADLGHFGELPIQIDWFSLVGLSLVANYFGQGALLLSDPQAAHNPFYRMAPAWALYPLVVLATAAAIIASQAIISGAFSLTRQAVQLGYLPRVEVIHTSETEIGQIYIPGANWALMLATIGLVLGFRTSSNVASAYGVAVTATMLITTLLAYVVTRRVWGWSVWQAGAVTGVFLVMDLAFFGANIVKVAAGGWFPLVVAAAVFAVMTTWEKGRTLLAGKLRQRILPVETLLADVKRRDPQRVAGTAVFLTGDAEGTPIGLLHNLKHNKVLHNHNLFVTVRGEEYPYVPAAERLEVTDLGQGFYRLVARYGFMEDPDVPAVLARAREGGLKVDPQGATYILSRNLLTPAKRPTLPAWRQKLFMFLARNAHLPAEYFRLPPNRVVELGMQVEI
jgi:KUP system potassium uptake protein